ncbi:uncharacterized protein LOC128992389 [Macrosteles quadrilineatus]|uniref:uncharacterized protein LOC128992389 n=1 Tax=Macrosteles quadrilineatus TaxID=74068 RepID=UPI0023E2291A|nr:uncharacterized protein LOC128992389 [Macrosteles quadrilineatus]
MKYLMILLFLIASALLTFAQLEASISCVTCTSYTLTINNSSTSTLLSCPVGTVCGDSDNATSVCSATNECDRVVCDHYAVFPSSSSCRQYHVCRYIRGYGTFALSTYTCPGNSRFDSVINKCTLNTARCYNATASNG